MTMIEGADHDHECSFNVVTFKLQTHMHPNCMSKFC